MTRQDDAALDTALANALGTEDTAPLSRAVLTRLAEPSAPRHAGLADVLVLPVPATGLLLGALLLAGAVGYAIPSGEVEEILMLQILLGVGG